MGSPGLYTYKGKQYTLTELSIYFPNGVSTASLYCRINNYGFSVKDAVETLSPTLRKVGELCRVCGKGTYSLVGKRAEIYCKVCAAKARKVFYEKNYTHKGRPKPASKNEVKRRCKEPHIKCGTVNWRLFSTYNTKGVLVWRRECRTCSKPSKDAYAKQMRAKKKKERIEKKGIWKSDFIAEVGMCPKCFSTNVRAKKHRDRPDKPTWFCRRCINRRRNPNAEENRANSKQAFMRKHKKCPVCGSKRLWEDLNTNQKQCADCNLRKAKESSDNLSDAYIRGVIRAVMSRYGGANVEEVRKISEEVTGAYRENLKLKRLLRERKKYEKC